MKKCIITIIGATVVAMAFVSCDRVKVWIDPDGTQKPKVVTDEQKRQQWLQNMTWTPENQRTYPKEYCQAMLKDLEEKEKQLDVVLHKVLIGESELGREVANLEKDMKTYGGFLDRAKLAYREAEARGTWPTTFNGRQISQEELQKRIVEAGKKFKRAEARLPDTKDKLAVVSKKKGKITQEQDKVKDLQQAFQDTIRDIDLTIIAGGDFDLGKSLDSLSDSLKALGQSKVVGMDDMSFELPPEEELQADFNAIMAD